MTKNKKDYYLFPVVNMGEHFFLLPPNVGDDYNCDEGHTFLQILYWQGNLNGFIFSHSAHLEGPRWEIPTAEAISNIAIGQPTCVSELADAGRITTMHVYMSDYIVPCA